MRFGMGCEAQTTAIAWLLRGFATTQTARSRARTHEEIVNTFLGRLRLGGLVQQTP